MDFRMHGATIKIMKETIFLVKQLGRRAEITNV
jgi:hypothetical protein